LIYFIGAGPGDPDLITVKAREILERADAVLYTGSLVPRKVIDWAKSADVIEDSQTMNYEQIFAFLKKHSDKTVARVHTGDPSLFSTIAKQIGFLRREGIAYEVVPGVTAAFGAAASLGIEYTVPGVSQTLILSRVEGRTPQPEALENILACKDSSLVFYLSIAQIERLVSEALKLGYRPTTPCWVVERATWSEERVYRGTLEDIAKKVSHIKGVALIMLGDFLYQEEAFESHLYAKSQTDATNGAGRASLPQRSNELSSLQNEAGPGFRAKKISIITINTPSFEAAKRLRSFLGEFQVKIYAKGATPGDEEGIVPYEDLESALVRAWRESDAVIPIVALGAVVRKIAPLLRDKRSDPAVVALNLQLNRIVPLLGGHLGGANELACLLEKRLPEAVNFITTATDQTGTLSFEMLARRRNWRIENLERLANISNRLLNKEAVKVATYAPIFESIEEREHLRRVGFDEIDANTVVIAPVETEALWLIPEISIGIGCNRGTEKQVIREAFYRFLEGRKLKRSDVRALASFEAKRDEAGLLEFAEEEGLELRFFGKSEIEALEGEFSASRAGEFFGLKGVAEPAAVLASRYRELVFKKEVYFRSVTIAAAV